MPLNTNRIVLATPQSIQDAYRIPNIMLDVTISNPIVHTETKNTFTDYEIKVKTNIAIFKLKESCVRRRYRDFVWLKDEIEKHCDINIPSLPGKALTKQLPFISQLGLFDPEFIETRRAKLELFLRTIIYHPIVQSHNSIHMFLQDAIIDPNYVPRFIEDTSGSIDD